MCGILLAVQRVEDLSEDFEASWEQLKTANSARGPDAQESIHIVIKTDNGASLDVRFFASELRLRGNKPVVQPYQELGNVFCWNGEVFEGLDMDSSENDGVKLFQAIKTLREPEADLTGVFQSIEGPYAFSYFHEATHRLYFGRDPLGRRSLLVHKPTVKKPILIVSSVSTGLNPLYDLEEVRTEHLHCADLNLWNPDESASPSITLRTLSRGDDAAHTGDFSTPARVNTAISDAPSNVDSLSVIPPELEKSVNDLLYYLSLSVKLKVQDIPYHGEKGQARVAVLFSGGIDSTILAYLADRLVYYLTSDSELKGKFESYLVPDRVTGLEELVELRKLCPHRRWNFVEVDVTFEETSKFRPVVESLMYPCNTVMDLSLALALYFASRGIGFVRDSFDAPKVPYTSTARVLINGLGSDELLGGYGRHRTAYTSGGWPAVIEDLQLEIDRIPTRNLGRDDRIISCHGKEARHPFLSLSVVNFLATLPVNYKMDPRLSVGLGDKMLLRLAAWKVGLELASARKKRAMQFGSHSARMEAGESERRGDIIIN